MIAHPKSMHDRLLKPLIQTFQLHLMRWDKSHNERKHIWNQEQSPYRVWVREIMLQQTRIEQAKPYYDRFIARFPHVHQLAEAEEKEVFKLWEGLGYYSRCRNLIATAKTVVQHHEGIFPTSYEALTALKGIGDYTASAILSFCYHQDYAVYDGNVERVLARFLGIKKDLRQEKNKNDLRALANAFLLRKSSATYNQAIMDFGAVVCKPKYPLCHGCAMNEYCRAYQKKIQHQLPIKSPKTKPKEVYYLFLLVQKEDEFIALQYPKDNPLWKALRLFPSVPIEEFAHFQDEPFLREQLKKHLPFFKKNLGKQASFFPEIYAQTLSHRKVKARFVHLSVKDLSRQELDAVPFEWVEKKLLYTYSFPVLIKHFLATYSPVV